MEDISVSEIASIFGIGIAFPLISFGIILKISEKRPKLAGFLAFLVVFFMILGFMLIDVLVLNVYVLIIGLIVGILYFTIWYYLNLDSTTETSNDLE